MQAQGNARRRAALGAARPQGASSGARDTASRSSAAQFATPRNFSRVAACLRMLLRRSFSRRALLGSNRPRPSARRSSRQSRAFARRARTFHPHGACGQPRSRTTRAGMGRSLPCACPRNPAGGASRARLRAHELAKTRAWHPRARSVCLCFLVRRLANTGTRAGGAELGPERRAARRRGAYMARCQRMASVRSPPFGRASVNRVTPVRSARAPGPASIGCAQLQHRTTSHLGLCLAAG
jgi:hypothetical protein